MKNYSVLRADQEVCAIQINTAAYEPCGLLRGTPDPKAVIAFTGNYNWLNCPIGYLRVNGKDVTSINAYLDIRPVLVFDSADKRWRIINGNSFAKDKARYSWAFQAGPTLIKDQEVAVRSQEEKFRSDAIRKTAHVSVGITASGKLVVAYSFNWTLDRLAAYFKAIGCVSAMKMDGGHAAFLRFRPDDNHRNATAYLYGNSGKIPVGVQFLRG